MLDISYKGLLKRSYLSCSDCGLVIPLLGQAERTILGDCPSCIEGCFNYASKQERKQFIENYSNDLRLMLEGIEEEES